ncbi:hypothetical protein BWQ96_08051 [Gracilariopsis chorda]|uniref:Uncharacterized protein n=1 Tax=Gracilariopsis chorda TaxID=448386 RepID=A0A2V3IJK9_9FLOR|nr:hypothetical protein BWQ96_08051 [Gracilariopsis chorda]|eukprot:PXF42223.1 hypothetical protein BWQ96_08051 [Gracilariopsis chorda]
MEAISSSVTIGAFVLSVVKKGEEAVNKWYERKDLTEDNKSLLQRIQRHYAQLERLIPRIEHILSHDIIGKAKLDRLL